MMATPQQSQVRLLEDLPPELLGKIFDLCADDVAHGRETLLGLSVMNKYFRNVTASQLFKHVRFRDLPSSPGDEILHSITRFMAIPELLSHARTVSLYLNRLRLRGNDQAALIEPYHYLVLPKFVEALVRMPKVTELRIETGGGQGRRCLEGLHAAVHWCEADLNIRSLTVSFGSRDTSTYPHSEPYYEIDFLEALPQLKAFCFEGPKEYGYNVILGATNGFRATISSNLTQLRIRKACSGSEVGWGDHEISQLNLNKIAPELQHLSILGKLRRIPVSHLLERLVRTRLGKVKYVDVTDQQMGEKNPGLRGSHLVYVEQIARNAPYHESRSELAWETFRKCPQLRRICFVRWKIGEVYLRGYRDPVANSTGYISPETRDVDLGDIPEQWHHGVPHTTLLPFSGFTRRWASTKPLK